MLAWRHSGSVLVLCLCTLGNLRWCYSLWSSLTPFEVIKSKLSRFKNALSSALHIFAAMRRFCNWFVFRNSLLLSENNLFTILLVRGLKMISNSMLIGNHNWILLYRLCYTIWRFLTLVSIARWSSMFFILQ